MSLYIVSIIMIENFCGFFRDFWKNRRPDLEPIIEPITIEKSLHHFTQANRKPIMEKSEYFRLLGVPGLAG
jgi:hypothetical protein